MKILLADSNPASVQALLTAHGHVVKSADAVMVALALWMQEPFEALAVNMQDREIAGFKLIAAVRKKETETGKHIRIIALCRDLSERTRCLETGADAVVSCPAQETELAQAVKNPSGSGKTDASNADEPLKPPINKAAALGLVDGDEELFLEITRMLCVDARKYRELLQTALNAGNAVDVEKYAHTLKGASANICATPFKDAAAAVELAARKGDMALARSLSEKLEREYIRLMDHIAQILPS